MKKDVVIVILFFLISVLAFYFVNVNKSSKITEVKENPQGYIALEKIDGKYSNFTYNIEKQFIYFKDLDNVIIKQSKLNDSNFIVKYKDKILVSENELSEIIKHAEKIEYDRSNLYGIGNKILLYDRNYRKIFASIEKIDYKNKCEIIPVNDDEAICLIEIAIHSQDDPRAIDIVDFFETAESCDKKQYKDFFKIEKNIVGLKIPKDIEIQNLYIKSPFHEENVRKVKVNV